MDDVELIRIGSFESWYVEVAEDHHTYRGPDPKLVVSVGGEQPSGDHEVFSHDITVDEVRGLVSVLTGWLRQHDLRGSGRT